MHRRQLANRRLKTHVLPAGSQLPGCDVLFSAVNRPRPHNLIHNCPEEEHVVVCCALRVRLRHIVAGCDTTEEIANAYTSSLFPVPGIHIN